MAAFDDGDFATCKETVDRRFVDEALLELVDGETTRAASGRPMVATPRGVPHCAYT
jgi:hypothetical protein